MWEKSGAFTANRDSGKEKFTISMPPPNATGHLHVGHAVMLALEDIFIRFARMRGKEALWLPGTDHAAIATNAVMERKLKEEEGVTKNDVGREEFLQRLQEFVAGSRDTIRSQVRKMGSSCDWSRERFTMDASLNRCVNETFKKMYDDGLIYRGHRIVNWCPHCQSTLSDDEVTYIEKQETFFTIQYGPLQIGTTRPETKFGDTAVAVHPDDERYQKYIDKEIEIETAIGLTKLTVIADKDVDANFGTGALKVTPAHDFKDFEMAERHDLDVVQVIDEQGHMMEQAGPFAGMTTEECREKMVATMKEKGILVKEEPYTHNLSVCYRCKHPIEPLPKLQWFLDVHKKVKTWQGKWKKKEWSLKEVMQEVVRDHSITIVPERFEKTYFHWVDNLRDWCISRQIWWGHRIPVWYCVGDCVCRLQCKEPIVSVFPPEKCPHCGSSRFEQDPDTLDTWFSSALWTWSTLIDPEIAENSALTLKQVFEKSPDYQKFHPTTVMETGYDILFFWVARMILMTTYMVGDIPFETVYLHGLVRTRDGKKMSKSDPKTMIDPLDIIPKYGADALRLAMIVGQNPGNDTKLFEEKIAGYRNFVNKLWNASRFVLMQCEKEGVDPHTVIFDRSVDLSLADRALLSHLHLLIADISAGLDAYRLSEVGERMYSFVRDFYCDWYLELSKGEANVHLLVDALRTILIVLHPYCPFVTEELWTSLKQKDSGMLLLHPWPATEGLIRDRNAEKKFQMIIDTISAIRTIRSEQEVAPDKKITVVIHSEKWEKLLQSQGEHIRRLARIENLLFSPTGKHPDEVISSFLQDIEVHVCLEELIDKDKERENLRKEKEKCETHILGLNQQLKSKDFISKAPANIVKHTEEKRYEAEEKLKKIEERLKSV